MHRQNQRNKDTGAQPQDADFVQQPEAQQNAKQQPVAIALHPQTAEQLPGGGCPEQYVKTVHRVVMIGGEKIGRR